METEKHEKIFINAKNLKLFRYGPASALAEEFFHGYNFSCFLYKTPKFMFRSMKNLHKDVKSFSKIIARMLEEKNLFSLVRSKK